MPLRSIPSSLLDPRPILALLVILFLVAMALPAADPDLREVRRSAPDGRVAAHQVIRAAQATWIHGITEEMAHEHVGRAGVPVLLRLLSDPDFPRRDNVAAFLGHLGDDTATAAFLDYLARPPAASLTPEEDRALLLAPRALGRIASRGHDGALRALLQMTDPGGEGVALLPASRLASDPDDMLTDLLESAFHGLALSGRPEALDRLEDASAGLVPAVAATRDLSRSAMEALEFHERLRGEAGAPLSARGGTLAAPRPGQPDGWTNMEQILDESAVVHDSGLTYANHPDVEDPMTDARLDLVLAEGTLRAGREDFDGDVACCATFSRSGGARSFGAAGDGLDVIDDGDELRSVLNDPSARVKVVRAINYCGSTGSNIIGCAWTPGNGMALVRMSRLDYETVLWIHEYGHNTGLGHHADNRHIMYGVDYGTNRGLDQVECDTYHVPSSRAEMVPEETGTCADADGDLVHDKADNCPWTANHDQADTDQDGVGDACEDLAADCGNGVLEQGEACDGADLGGQSCAGLGFDGGDLSCTADCALDTSGCFNEPDPFCGNGVLEQGEECDGTDLGGRTCLDLGYDGGDLSCTAGCLLDDSACFLASCPDADADGYQDASCNDNRDAGGGDCNDADPTVHPGAPEVCNDGIDQDCNGKDKKRGCRDLGGDDPKTASENCKNGKDDDGDGLVDCADADCAGKRFCLGMDLLGLEQAR